MESSKRVGPHNSHSLLAREAKLLLKEGDKLLAITHRVGVHLVLAGDVGPSGVGGHTVHPPCPEAGLFRFCLTGLKLLLETVLNQLIKTSLIYQAKVFHFYKYLLVSFKPVLVLADIYCFCWQK